MHVNTAIEVVRCIYRCIDLCSIHNSSPSSSQRPELAKATTDLRWHCLLLTKSNRKVYRLAYMQLRRSSNMSCTLWCYIAPMCKIRILSISILSMYDTEIYRRLDCLEQQQHCCCVQQKNFCIHPIKLQNQSL